jgi:hypothetical protein
MPKIDYFEVVSNQRSDCGGFEVIERFINEPDAIDFVRRHTNRTLRIIGAEITIYDSMADYAECRLQDLKRSALGKLSVEEQEALGLLEVKTTHERKIGPELVSRLKGFVEGIKTGDIEMPNGPPKREPASSTPIVRFKNRGRVGRGSHEVDQVDHGLTEADLDPSQEGRHQ